MLEKTECRGSGLRELNIDFSSGLNEKPRMLPGTVLLVILCWKG
jgi:hypothetical protein